MYTINTISKDISIVFFLYLHDSNANLGLFVKHIYVRQIIQIHQE